MCNNDAICAFFLDKQKAAIQIHSVTCYYSCALMFRSKSYPPSTSETIAFEQAAQKQKTPGVGAHMSFIQHFLATGNGSE